MHSTVGVTWVSIFRGAQRFGVRSRGRLLTSPRLLCLSYHVGQTVQFQISIYLLWLSQSKFFLLFHCIRSDILFLGLKLWREEGGGRGGMEGTRRESFLVVSCTEYGSRNNMRWPNNIHSKKKKKEKACACLCEGRGGKSPLFSFKERCKTLTRWNASRSGGGK